MRLQRLKVEVLLLLFLAAMAAGLSGCVSANVPLPIIPTATGTAGEALGYANAAKAATTQPGAQGLVTQFLDTTISKIKDLSDQITAMGAEMVRRDAAWRKSTQEAKDASEKALREEQQRTQEAQAASESPILKALGWLMVGSLVGVAAAGFCAFYFKNNGAFYGAVVCAVLAGMCLATSTLMRFLHMIVPWVVGCVAALLVATTVLLIGFAIYELWKHRKNDFNLVKSIDKGIGALDCTSAAAFKATLSATQPAAVKMMVDEAQAAIKDDAVIVQPVGGKGSG